MLLSMSRILVGTTSWTEKTLVESGRFYPAEARSAEARLRYYASRFPVVEVDSTYYGLPSSRNASLWAARTPEEFVFDVKAFRLFTQHQTPPAALPREIRDSLAPRGSKNLYYKDLPAELLDELWERFRVALEPLRASGKLGAVMFQFAPWFVCRQSSREFIEVRTERLPGDRIAVEFRNKSWFADDQVSRTLDLEKDYGLTHVIVDEPQGFPFSIPPIWEVTSPQLSIVRFHGRNRETWQNKGITAAERFNYLYRDEELRVFAEPICSLERQADELHLMFNNCHRDDAQRNALQLQSILQGG